MFSRLTALHLIQKRSHHLGWLDWLSCHHCGHSQISNASHILNKTLTLLENIFSVSCIDQIMSKRGTVEKLDWIPVLKKTCPQMATGSKKSIDTNISCDSKTLKYPPNMSSASPAVRHHAASSTSSAENLEDSGIEVTPVVSKALARVPKMPGFALNPPKSLSGPKFSFASSDTGLGRPYSEASLQERNTLNKDIPAGASTVSDSPESEVDKRDHGGGGDSVAYSDIPPVTSHLCENTNPSVCVGKPSGDKSNDKSKTTTTISGSDVKSVSHRVDTKVSKTTDMVKSKVSNSSARRYNSTDNVKHKSSSSSIKYGEEHDVQSPQHPEQTVTQTPPIPKLSKDKLKQHVTTAEHKTAPPIPKQSKDKLRQHVTTAEHQTSKTQTSKGRHQSASASKGREAEEKSVVQNRAHQAKQSSPHSQSKTRKRGTAPKNDDPKKQLDLSSVTLTERKIVKKAQQAQGYNASDVSPEKKKKTVLPASLLKDVVRTVQENVGTISKQVVAAASSVEPLVPAAADSGTRNSREVEDSLAADTKCPVNKTGNNRTVRGAALSDLSKDTLTENAPTASDGKDTVCADPSVLANGQESETNLPSVLSVECVETEKPTSGQIQQKAKKKAKKKKKSKRQRKSTEGERENLLGVLPDYIPENDNRLNKKKEDKVYNLSALFSGQLLSSRPPPKRSRPNYFFAIQITNPEIKTGFSAVQQRVEDACPKLKPAFVSVEYAHLTLGVMHLPDEEAVTRVISVMEEFREVHRQQRLQGRQGPKEQDRHQEQTLEETRTASADLPSSPTCDSSSENPASVHVKSDTADPLKVFVSSPVCDSISDNPASIPVKSDAADPLKVSVSSDSVKSAKVDPSVIATADLVTADACDPVNTVPDSADCTSSHTEDPVDTDKAGPEKIEAADPDTTDAVEIKITDLSNSDAVDKTASADSTNAGSADGKKSDPADGGKKSDPADVREKSDPIDGEKSDPADVGEKSDPIDGEKSDPADVADKSDPIDGEKSNPADVRETSDPIDGEKSDPADVGEQSDPADGEKTIPGLMLEVKGLDTFNNYVVFAKVTEGAALDQVKAMAELLRSRVVGLNIIMDSRPFAPHITLMKMSKDPGKLRASGIKKIDGRLYQEFNDTHFGRNAVTSIQLCSMLKPKQNKYYHIEHEIPVSLD